MSAKIDFLYLSEPDMIKAGVKDMGKCVEVMEDMMVTLKKPQLTRMYGYFPGQSGIRRNAEKW